MIFATVGTHKQGFERMVQAFDLLARENEFDEELIIQYGTSGYVPQHATAFQWATSQRMDQLTQSARILVTHAAAGAIILGLQAQKPLVVIPRRKQFEEHMDDHQLQLANALEQSGRAVALLDPTATGLARAIGRADEQTVTKAAADFSTKHDAKFYDLKQTLRERMATLSAA